MEIVVAVGVGLFVLIALHAGTRGSELFYVSVRGNKMIVVRGRAPASLLAALGDVLERANVKKASIRALKTSSHARLVVDGVDGAIEQRLRNVFGTFPMARLTSAPLPSKRNLGQILGFAWLAWLLSSS